MLYVNLPMGGVIMPEYEEPIAKALELDTEAVTRLVSGMDYVTDELQIIPCGENNDVKAKNVHIGSEAVKVLLESKGIDVNAVMFSLEEAEVPRDVFYYCKNSEWYDICSLFARIENRTERIIRLTTFDDLPAVIGCNEYRMMREAVIALDRNGVDKNYHPVTRPDGRVLRSLAVIGYSLENEWSEEMEEYFRKMDNTQEEAEDE